MWSEIFAVYRKEMRGYFASPVPYFVIGLFALFMAYWFFFRDETAFFLYDDRPGVLGTIGSKLAENGVNIEDVRNPHDPKTNRSLAIMKVNQPVSAELANEIGKAIDAHTAVSIVL